MTYAIAQDLLSFHSIGFLCERGPEIAYVLVWDGRFPFNWFPLRERTYDAGVLHGTSPKLFPFNWFPLRERTQNKGSDGKDHTYRFPFNWFPLRERTEELWIECKSIAKFPFNWFPLRERTYATKDKQRTLLLLFPFNWFPLRERTRLQVGKCRFCISVSIQLVSSAREDLTIMQSIATLLVFWFPFNWFPLRERTLSTNKSYR